MAAEIVCVIALLTISVLPKSKCTITTPPDITSCGNGDITIPWDYSDLADMSTVEWQFVGSTTKTILIQAQGSVALVQGGFNVKHISNGAINITNPTTANTGTYRITVTYSGSIPVAVDEVVVYVHDKPTGLSYTNTSYTNTSSGQQITFTCVASSFGGPVPATLFIKVDSVESAGVSAKVTIDKEKVECCLKGDAAKCLDNQCVTAQAGCICGFSKSLEGADIASIVLSAVCIVVVIIFIILQPALPWNPPQWLKILVTILVIAIALYAVIIGAITVATNHKCRNCTSTCDIPKCDSQKRMGIANIVLFFIDVVVLIVFLMQGKRKQQYDGVKDGASDQEMMSQQNKTSQ